MGLKSVMERLQRKEPATSATFGTNQPLQQISPFLIGGKPPATAVTSATSCFADVEGKDVSRAISSTVRNPADLFWPKSQGMSASETALLEMRTVIFAKHGMTTVDSERLAFKMTQRDRDLDDRRLCLECLHLHRAGGWRCGNWLRAGVAMRAKDAQLPGDLVMQLQRCDGFKDMTQ